MVPHDQGDLLRPNDSGSRTAHAQGGGWAGKGASA